MKQRTITALSAAVACLSLTTSLSAASLEALQGAWTMEGTTCEETFHKTAGGIQFLDRTSSLTTGILISGSKITGPNGACTAQRVRESGDHFTVLLGCADAIMFDSFPISFRVIDADHFERFDPNFPDVSFRYQRCAM